VRADILPTSSVTWSTRDTTEQHNSISERKIVIMQIGGLNSWRSHTDFLLNQYRIGHDKFELMLHGVFDHEILSMISLLPQKPTMSKLAVPFDKISPIVDQCSIGFVGYKPLDEQFRLIKNASGQLVEFLRCGKPVLIMGGNNLGELLERKQAGCIVSNSDQFFSALKEIREHYHEFSKNASLLFYEMYDLNKYEKSLYAFLETVTK
jgi:glycosyltransferase involved in cell wall biosynthesis